MRQSSTRIVLSCAAALLAGVGTGAGPGNGSARSAPGGPGQAATSAPRDVPPPSAQPGGPFAPRSGAPGEVAPSYAAPRSEMSNSPGAAALGPRPVEREPVLPNTPESAPAAASGPYTIALGGRHAGVLPRTVKFGGAEGGTIDVAHPTPDSFSVLLSGAAAATAYLGCRSAASETFELTQEFRVTSADPDVRTVVLTLDSTLVGYLRSKHRSAAGVKLASASVSPMDWPGPALAVAHPAQGIAGTSGRLCNLQLPPVQSPPLPVGRYVLTARFEIEANAGGALDAHSAADFSPDATFPEPFVRQRDPFQGVSKKGFGFSVVVTATPSPRRR